jgi:hypothetical protein
MIKISTHITSYHGLNKYGLYCLLLCILVIDIKIVHALYFLVCGCFICHYKFKEFAKFSYIHAWDSLEHYNNGVDHIKL